MVSKKRTLQKQGKYGTTVRIPPDFLEWLKWEKADKYLMLLDSENKQIILRKIEE